MMFPNASGMSLQHSTHSCSDLDNKLPLLVRSRHHNLEQATGLSRLAPVRWLLLALLLICVRLAQAA